MLPRRVLTPGARYAIHVIGGGLDGSRKTIRDNDGAGYTYPEVCETLCVQLSYVGDYPFRRVVRRGLEFLVIDDKTPTHSARYWLEEMEDATI